MARTKGAKDNRPRKKPAAKPRKTSPAVTRLTKDKVQHEAPPAEIQRPAIPPDDFEAAIAAELHKASPSLTGPDTLPADAAFTHNDDVSAPGPTFDPASLTLDGLASAWQLVYYAIGQLLALFRVTPDPEPVYAVGRRRGKELAKPSYALYEHWTREYLDLNPDNTLHVAGGATVLNFVGTVPEIIDAVQLARKRAQQQQQVGPTPARPAGA